MSFGTDTRIGVVVQLRATMGSPGCRKLLSATLSDEHWHQTSFYDIDLNLIEATIRHPSAPMGVVVARVQTPK